MTRRSGAGPVPPRLSRRTFGAALAALLARPVPSQASFAKGPLRMVVPFAPGGGTDIIARLLAAEMAPCLGQPVVVENRAGASGQVGARAVQTAPADGHTILLATSTFTATAVLGERPTYDPIADFAPLCLLANAPNVLVVGAERGPLDLAALRARAADAPTGLNYATFGSLSTPHLAAVGFQKATGTRMTQVTYRGGGPASLAVVTGEADLLFSSLLPVLPLIQAGTLRALAVASDDRIRALADVPTFREAGVNFRSGTWFGLVTGRNVPPGAVRELSVSAIDAIRTPSLSERLLGEGTEIVASEAEIFDGFLKDDTARLAALRGSL